MIKKFLIALTIFFLPLAAMSNEVNKAKIEVYGLSFEQAYILMLENNNLLKAYTEAIEEKKFEKRAALGKFAPQIGLNATYMHFSDDMTLSSSGSVMGIPFAANTLIQDKNIFGAGGVAVWNIFTGGKLLSNHAIKRAQLEASNAKYSEIEGNLTLELVKRYYGLRFLKDVLQVRGEVEKGFKKHLDEAKILEKVGMISKSERLHAQVAYSDALRDYKAAKNDVNIAQAGLIALIKSDEANLDDVEVEPVSKLFVVDNLSINLDEIKKNLPNTNPQLKQLSAKKKALNAKYHAQVGQYSPNVSLVAYDIAMASHMSEAVPRLAVGGTVNWALFDGFSRYNNVKAANAERKSADFEFKDAVYNIETLLVKQNEELLKNEESYLSSTSSLENATEALRVANVAFKEGFGTSLQVTDAQMMLSKVKIDRLKSIYAYDVALCDLLKTAGATKEIVNYVINSKQEKL